MMQVQTVETANGTKRIPGAQRSRFKELMRQYRAHKYLLLMLIPGLAYYALFHYGPIYGVQLAFKNYRIVDGIWGSPWVGLKHFIYMFNGSPDFMNILANTIIISTYRLIFEFPMPILLALILNEIRFVRFKKISQTILYLPHFLSWVIMAGVLTTMLSPSIGIVNYVLGWFGVDPIYFLGDKAWFRPTLIATNIWKEVGWDSILYMAAIVTVDTEQYEAAIIDGAKRWQQIVYITIPSIMHVIAIVFLLTVGQIMDAGFDQIFNLYNPRVYEVSDIIDTYVYRIGLVSMRYDFATAVGLFKNVVGLILILATNYAVKKMGQEGLY